MTNENEVSYVGLESVGSIVTENGMVFPLDCSEAPETASEADEMMGVHLLDTDDDWWGNMSIADSNELMGFLTPLFFSGNLSFWDFPSSSSDNDNFVDWGMERLQYVINTNSLIDELENTLLSGGTI